MIGFDVVNVVVDGPNSKLLGLSDIEFVQIGANWMVLASATGDSAVSTFGFANGQLTGLVQTLNYSTNSGTQSVWGLNVSQIAGKTALLPTTRYEDSAIVYEIGATGLGASVVGGGGIDGLRLSHTATVGTRTYVYEQNTSAGLTIYRLEPDLTLTTRQGLGDNSNMFLGDVSAITSLAFGGETFLFVASAYDTGVNSFRINPNGSLNLRDTISPASGSGFYRVADASAVIVDGKAFVIIASAGTSSLTAYEMNIIGELSETDHVIDTLETRFQGASTIETFKYDGRVFVVAAGNDDGLSILEISPKGNLIHMASIADTYDITLDNISAISVEVIGDTVILMVGSDTEHGFTQINLDMSNLRPIIEGQSGNDILAGGALGEEIYAGDGNDTVDGGDGDDVIRDGGGRDVLTGGLGSDVFVFTPDQKLDVVTDFQNGADLLDLSMYAGVYGIDDIEIAQFCHGVRIVIHDDQIIIENYKSVQQLAVNFTAEDFIF